MVSLTYGYFKTNLIQKGYALINIYGDADKGGYMGIQVKKMCPAEKGSYFRLDLSANHSCCGEVSLACFNLSSRESLRSFNKTCFKEVLREILAQNNNIVSYLTAGNESIQTYYASLLKDVGFKPVFECINKNSGNLCTVWMADLSTLNLY